MKSYTDLEQAKKLAEILPLETADHHYVRKVQDSMGEPVDGKWNPNSSYADYIVMGFANFETIPCWSLAALLDVLPFPNLFYNDGWNLYVTINDKIISINNVDNSIDACVEMILKLHELNLL